MGQSYLIADGLTRIRNSQLVGKSHTTLLYSKTMMSLLDILLNQGYILSKETFCERKGVNRIKVFLKYSEGKKTPAISRIQVISKPGRRLYRSYRNTDSMCGGLGIVILSTSQGLMTDHQVKELRIGGEVLCKVF